MPRGDRTGPLGMGPMTGRGAGFCAGYSVPGYMNPWVVHGRGFGMGFGRGRGFRRAYRHAGFPAWVPYGFPVYGGPYAPAPEIDEKAVLSKQAEYLENQLQQVKNRLQELAGDAE